MTIQKSTTNQPKNQTDKTETSIERTILCKQQPSENAVWTKSPPCNEGWFWFKTDISIRLFRIVLTDGTPWIMGSDDVRDPVCCAAKHMIGEWAQCAMVCFSEGELKYSIDENLKMRDA